MAKKSFEKTAGIDMSGFHSRAKTLGGKGLDDSGKTMSPDESRMARNVGKTFTGAGIFMAAITGKEEVSKELKDAKTRLMEFEGATLVRALDPKSIRRSQWANRVEAEFSTQEFQQLKEEILNAGCNVQPIKVRIVKDQTGVFDGQTPNYEIVFGHRRHQACLELGLRVSAIVDDNMDDKALFEAMDRENRGRKNLSAWEQGRMYEAAITKGLYPSLRRLAESLGVNLSDASRAQQLAKLPKEVVNAFATPLDLQVRWAKPLADALQRDPDGVLTSAREVGKKRGGLTSTEILNRLIGKKIQPLQQDISILSDGKTVATLSRGSKGTATIEFEQGGLAPAKYQALAKLIEKFLAGV